MAAPAPETGRPPRVLVLVGRGRYEDPWHDMAATAADVVTTLTSGQDGLPVCDVRVRGTFPGALDGLDPAGGDVDLVVVNSSSGRTDPEFDGDDDRWAGFHERLRAWVDGGRPVLALHQAANTFADSPHWERLLGGRWVVGTSMHPEIGDATFTVVDTEHPLSAGLADVTAFDERYSYLRVAPTSRVLLTQSHDGVDHPVVWVNETDGRRVVYDALGHGPRAYESPTRRALLVAELRHLLG